MRLIRVFPPAWLPKYTVFTFPFPDSGSLMDLALRVLFNCRKKLPTHWETFLVHSQTFLKDGTKSDRTFSAEEDHSSKKKPTRKCTMVCESVKTSRRWWRMIDGMWQWSTSCVSGVLKMAIFGSHVSGGNMCNKWVPLPPSLDASQGTSAEGEHRVAT